MGNYHYLLQAIGVIASCSALILSIYSARRRMKLEKIVRNEMLREIRKGDTSWYDIKNLTENCKRSYGDLCDDDCVQAGRDYIEKFARSSGLSRSEIEKIMAGVKQPSDLGRRRYIVKLLDPDESAPNEGGMPKPSGRRA